MHMSWVCKPLSLSRVTAVDDFPSSQTDTSFSCKIASHVCGSSLTLLYSFRHIDNVGDKICIFGFSRGAYTARALAGMVHKVRSIDLSQDHFERVGTRSASSPRPIINKSLSHTRCLLVKTRSDGIRAKHSRKRFVLTLISSSSAYGSSYPISLLP